MVRAVNVVYPAFHVGLAGLPANTRLQRLCSWASRSDVPAAGADGSPAVPAAALSAQVFQVSR